MKVAVRMPDGKKIVFKYSGPDIDSDELIALVRKEIPNAATVLVEVKTGDLPLIDQGQAVA
mgnify:CR=1 FL=1